MAQKKRTGQKAGTGSVPVRLSPVERIHRTLTGDVADIYIRHVPAFKGLDRERVYNMVMSNHALAMECYKLFEARPDLFAHLMIDRVGAPVGSPGKKLFCGRSVEDVTAMLVRAVAKRHFLGRFGVQAPMPKRPEPKPEPSTSRLFVLFRRSRPKSEPEQPKIRRKATRGDSLYRAMRQHLRYPWQLKLIPHYTPLPVSTVRQLGARILEYRSVRDLKQLLKDGPPQEAPAGAKAPEAPTLIRVKLPESRQGNSVADAKADAMWTVAESLGLAETFAVDEAEMRKIVTRAAVASGSVITALAASGLSMRAMVVMLCAFERSLGQARLPGLFGPGAPKSFLEALKSQIGTAGLSGLDNPEDIRNRVEVIIRRMQRDETLN
ncbi:MAG TPA: hypothetical protein VKP60_04650 [Magnetospirillaceae bacterium]|nr:hypothetical protein [Magnetospirillaceae bacterium]